MPPPADSGRDVLFGLIAHLNGFVNEAGLAQVLKEWSDSRAIPLASLLVARRTLDPSLRTAIEVMVDAQINRYGGIAESALENLTTLPCVLAYLGSVSDLHATTTHGDFDTKVALGSTEPAETIDAPAISLQVGAKTSSGRRFRVLRAHKKGGLGAVFVALDSELNREVAFKQIHEHHADDEDTRARFLLEAEVTGGLEHPGIVPVYGLGSDERGRPYYAMRFIRGKNLKDALSLFHAKDAWDGRPGDRSLEFRKMLRRFLDVCNAIEYAHRRKVIHRDLKPGNIMVGRYGETLVVDWGLAKTAGTSATLPPNPLNDIAGSEPPLILSSSSGTVHTLPGSEIGTPAYMSPEQAAGDIDNIGPASDVYSLGATLYTLLTGRPPYVETEGNRDVKRLLERVRRGEFPHPRSIDPSLDPAIEAVCLKAMALQAENRYTSPLTLAEDVERWMADEPVSAYPDGLMRKAARWARRHRAWTRAAAVSALIITIISVTSTVVIEKAMELEARSRRVAETNFRAAHNMVKQMLHKTAREELAFLEKTDPLRERLGNDAARQSEALLRQQPDNRELRRFAAEVRHEAGNVERMMGGYEKARSHYLAAIEHCERITAEFPDDTQSRLLLNQVYIDAAEGFRLAGKTREAITYFKAAEALARDMLSRFPRDRNPRKVLATSLVDLAATHRELRQFGDAERAHDEGIALWDAVAIDPADTYGFMDRWVHAIALRDRAIMLKEAGKLDASMADLRRAEKILGDVAADWRDNNNTRYLMASTHNQICELHALQEDLELAEIEFGAVSATLANLVSRHPETVVYQVVQAQALDGRGILRLKRAGKWSPLAESDCLQALVVLEPLKEKLRDNFAFQTSLMKTCEHLAELAEARGAPQEAVDRRRQASEWKALATSRTKP